MSVQALPRQENHCAPAAAPARPDTSPPAPHGYTHALDLPTGHLQVQIEQSRLPFDDLLGFAARDNAKRGFLFLSRVLGKHWPVTPAKMQQIHLDLASRIPAGLPQPVLFIALAETAIGLGQGVFEAWLERQPLEPQSPQPPALFLHSSRYRVGSGELIEFEESHSHAPRQFLHMPQEPHLAALLAGARSLVLVDDEASTGNTFVNLCHALRGVCPNLAQVHLALITDFMGQATRAALGQRFGLPTSIGATLSGQYQFTPAVLPPTTTSAPTAQRFDATPANGASPCFGRLGLAQALPTQALDALAKELSQQIGTHESVLVLGTGEFMHAAFLLARALEQHGRDVKVQASTRSPILSWGAVVTRMQFSDNYGENIANYLYNVSPRQYHHVLICHETAPDAALLDLARCLQGRLFHFQNEAKIEEIPVC